MYHTTGLTSEQITELCALISARWPQAQKRRGRKRALGLFNTVRATLMYLRRNHVQQELAEIFAVSQATISRIISITIPRVVAVLGDIAPAADDLDPTAQLLVDSTLVPCWSWRDHPELWSGKHRTTGLNLQVACTLSGQLAWISDPMPGRTHDITALRDSGLLLIDNAPEHVGDKGYIGAGTITPIRKPPGGRLHDTHKDFNRQVNSIRATIERVIANLKTWRALHTDYRRPLDTFPEAITAIIALEFWRAF